MNTADRVAKIIAENLQIDRERVTPEASLVALGADSLSVLEMVLALEEEFDLDIDCDNLGGAKTVQDAIGYVTHLLEQRDS